MRVGYLFLRLLPFVFLMHLHPDLLFLSGQRGEEEGGACAG